MVVLALAAGCGSDDHANEQPFTRSLSGVEIPDDVSIVTIQGRDQVNGRGGATLEIRLQG